VSAEPAGADVVVRVEDLKRRYGALTAVDGVSFTIRRKEMFGLIGPDGAGKTTTLRVLLGLLKPDAGRVSTCGLDPIRKRRELSSRVGYLSQRFSLYGDLSVDENIAFFVAVHDVERYEDRRDELLAMVRMDAFRRRLASRLSGGMKQKLALVCTLVHTPELLVLDEPTTGVDPVSRREFWEILLRMRTDGMTILVSTAYLDEGQMCDRLVLMHNARILADGTVAQIQGDYPDLEEALIGRIRAVDPALTEDGFGS
jgi:ABC-2 type transport system ATP-binding protein